MLSKLNQLFQLPTRYSQKIWSKRLFGIAQTVFARFRSELDLPHPTYSVLVATATGPGGGPIDPFLIVIAIFSILAVGIVWCGAKSTDGVVDQQPTTPPHSSTTSPSPALPQDKYSEPIPAYTKSTDEAYTQTDVPSVPRVVPVESTAVPPVPFAEPRTPTAVPRVLPSAPTAAVAPTPDFCPSPQQSPVVAVPPTSSSPSESVLPESPNTPLSPLVSSNQGGDLTPSAPTAAVASDPQLAPYGPISDYWKDMLLSYRDDGYELSGPSTAPAAAPSVNSKPTELGDKKGGTGNPNMIADNISDRFKDEDLDTAQDYTDLDPMSVIGERLSDTGLDAFIYVDSSLIPQLLQILGAVFVIFYQFIYVALNLIPLFRALWVTWIIKFR